MWKPDRSEQLTRDLIVANKLYSISVIFSVFQGVDDTFTEKMLYAS